MSEESSNAVLSTPLRSSSTLYPLHMASTPISTNSTSTGGVDDRLAFWRSSETWSPSLLGSLQGISLQCSTEDRAPLSPGWAEIPVNVTTSSGPICRICHESDQKWPLLSPCACSGTMGLVHVTCLEHWLSASGSDNCEICHHRFSTERRTRGLCEWLEAHRNVRRSVLGDFLCFVMLTPLAFLCSILCLQGAAHVILSARLWEAIGLITLAVMLFIVYTGWSILTFRFYRKTWKKWQKANPYVRVLGVADIPAVSVPQCLCEDVECHALPIAPTSTCRSTFGETATANASVHDESFSLQSPTLCFSPTTVTSGSTQWEYCTSRL